MTLSTPARLAPARLGIFALLALVMTGTRVNHFGLIPDASWAVFFIAGFYLSASLRWAFPTLMVLAVAVDYAVITGAGQNFWSHYCVSPGYWLLLPAHASLWLGGSLLARLQPTLSLRGLAMLASILVSSVAICHAFAQGGFYWLSDSVANPSVAGWLQNYSDWLLPYLQTSVLYVAIATALHALALALHAQHRSPQTL